MARRAGMIGLDWDDIAQFAADTKEARVYLDDLKKTWVYWFDGGGALTKKVADDCADFIRAEVYSQEAFEGMPRLSPIWEKIKNKQGLSPEIGIASGVLVNAIKPINQGHGKYKVGISRNVKNPGLGKIDSVATYARLLEKGHDYIGKDGKRYHQPPRPFFSTSFIKWANRALPDRIRSTIWKDMYPELMKLYEKMGASMARYAPEDLYVVTYAGEGASDAQEVFQESTETGGTTFGQAPTEFTGEGAEQATLTSMDVGVTGRPDYEGGFDESDYTEIPGYPESQRTDEIVGAAEGGESMTMGGDVFNENDQMWQDIETYMKRVGKI